MYTSRAYTFLQPDKKSHSKKVMHLLVPQKDDRMLEIGCGRGYTVKRMQRFVPETIGIDVNEAAIQRGVTHGLYKMDAQALAFSDETFDKIYSFHTIEHIPDITGALKEIERVLKPGGKALLVYPAEPIRGLFAGFAATFILKNPLRAREIHIHKLSPSIFQKLIEGSNLHYLESGFSFLPGPQYYTLLQKS